MALAQGNLELGAELMNFSPYLLLLGGSSLSRVLLGEVAEGGNRLRQCLHLAQERDDLLIQAWTHGWLAQWGYYAGVTTGAMAHGRAAAEAAERLASAAVQVPAYWSLGLAAMLEGDLAEAGRALERAREVNRESWHGPNYEAATQAALAETYQLLGDTEKAIATIDETSTDAGRNFEHIIEPEAFVQLARARILIRGDRRGERATIEAALARVHELVIDADLRVFLPLIALERACLAELLGDDAERVRQLREALRLFSEMGATGHAERLAKELGG